MVGTSWGATIWEDPGEVTSSQWKKEAILSHNAGPSFCKEQPRDLAACGGSALTAPGSGLIARNQHIDILPTISSLTHIHSGIRGLLVTQTDGPKAMAAAYARRVFDNVIAPSILPTAAKDDARDQVTAMEAWAAGDTSVDLGPRPMTTQFEPNTALSDAFRCLNHARGIIEDRQTASLAECRRFSEAACAKIRHSG